MPNMPKMKLPSTPLHKVKLVLHSAQAALIVLLIVLTIAVFASSGRSDGRTGWFFGLCWLSIPIIIYQAMVPAWPRAKKFANIYAFVSLDCFGAVAWLSAWAAVASYVVSGKGKGTVKDATGCGNFKFGSAAKCRLSEATIVFGVFVMLLFVATAIISFKAVMEYSQTGALPGGDSGMGMGGVGALGGSGGGGGKMTGHTEEEEAFDSNMNQAHDWEVEEYEQDDYHDHHNAGGRQGNGSSSAGQYDYAPAHADDHGDDYDRQYNPAGSAVSAMTDNTAYHNYGAQSSVSGYADDHDLTSQRPASTGPGPLGGDTSYHSPSYGQSNQYSR